MLVREACNAVAIVMRYAPAPTKRQPGDHESGPKSSRSRPCTSGCTRGRDAAAPQPAL
jgi:hypothetical protein